MSSFSKLGFIAISAGLIASTLIGSQPASAYPVGQSAQVLLNKSSNLASGSIVKAKATNLGPGCQATFFLNSNPVAGGTQLAPTIQSAGYETQAIAFAAPDAAGTYYVVLEINQCKSSSDNGTISTALSVGGKYLGKTTLWSGSLSVSKNPRFQVSARVSFAGKGISGILAKIVVTNPRGRVVFSGRKTSSSTGRVYVQFENSNALPGKYRVVVTFKSKGDFTGLVSQDTTILHK